MGNKISKSVHRSKYTDELDISYIELKAYPSQVSSLLNITLLNLAGNQIKKLDGVGIDKLVHLVTLDISGNKFSDFPRVILSLTKLKQLNVAFNQIKAIPDDINKLVELRKLNASGTAISTLPDTIGDLKNLTELSIEKNNLMDLPMTLINLKELRTIAVKGNPWIKIPFVLAKLQGPEEISLSEGQIKDIDVEIIMEFHKNPSIKVLDLRKNQIRTVPPEFTELYTLREVVMLGNPIKQWPERVRAMMNLTYNFDDELKAQLWAK